MKSSVWIIALCMLGHIACEDFENDVYKTIQDYWDAIGKEEDGYVSYYDLVNFFKFYDNDYDRDDDSGVFSVDEDEFAEKWSADFNVSDDAARAYFKRTDVTQYHVDFLPERVTETDCLLWIDQLDIDGDGYLSEFEFVAQNEFLYSDLSWGVQFIRYRTKGTSDFGYDDVITYDYEDTGDFQRIFDDIDGDGDGYFTRAEARTYYESGGYGSEEFADLFFFTADFSEDGRVDKQLEWALFYSFVDESGIFAPLNYRQYTALDYEVRPFP